MANFYGATSLIGGGTGALDDIDGSNLNDNDGALVITATGVSYSYTLDATSGLSESSPDRIVPDANAGTKVWILKGVFATTLQLPAGTSINEISTDGTLAGDSDDALVTEKGIKTYVDAQRLYVKVSDVKSSGTNGGTFTQDAWQTRDLNTEDSDDGNICSLSSNQITLDAGTYECRISAPGYLISRHKTRLRNVTGGVTLLEGSSEMSFQTGNDQTRSFVSGKFTVAASQALEVQHYCINTQATIGFGSGMAIGVDEVYTIAEFWKVA